MSDRQLKDLTLREQMEAWLRQQDPNEGYEYTNRANCACARFAHATGKFSYWWSVSSHASWTQGEEWASLNEHAFLAEPRTFGALLERLEKTDA